ncbi:MAG: hypothetical protein PHF48_01160, partial [Bacteroidales bacterium]|nr:hypothetical protein [Bacteroidales bacterium]
RVIYTPYLLFCRYFIKSKNTGYFLIYKLSLWAYSSKNHLKICHFPARGILEALVRPGKTRLAGI